MRNWAEPPDPAKNKESNTGLRCAKLKEDLIMGLNEGRRGMWLHNLSTLIIT